MAYDKIIDSAKLDGALSATADAIRAKAGGTTKIAWNETNGFAEAVGNISTIPTLQAKTATPSTSAQTVKPDSGYDGLSQVTVSAMPTATQATPSITVSTAGLITAKSTQTAGYVAAGTKSATKQLTAQAAKTVTPSTADQTAVAKGVYTTGAVTVKGDANLIPENILSGISIFGVEGIAASGARVATGSFTPTASTDANYGSGGLTVSGLGFKPSVIMIYLAATLSTVSGKNVLICIARTYVDEVFVPYFSIVRQNYGTITKGSGFAVDLIDDGFNLYTTNTSEAISTAQYNYIAIE